MVRQTYEQEDYNSVFKKITTDLLLGRSHKIKSSMAKGTNKTEGALLMRPKAWSGSDNTPSEDKHSVLDNDSFVQPSEVEHIPNNRNQGRQIFDLLETSTNDEIIQCINNLTTQYKIDQIINSEGLGLLHVACQNNNLDLVEYLIDKAEEIEGKRYVKMLVNMKCKNRDMSFTPSHFCAYNGNIDLLNILQRNGASILIPNDQGVKALHVAAQGDQAAMIYYLVKTLN